MPQKIILDIDDLHITAPNFEYFLKLKEHFPNFKVTFFTIPVDPWLLSGKIDMKRYEAFAEMVKSYDWIEIAVHGFMHDKKEMVFDSKGVPLTYQQAKDTIIASERSLTKVRFREKLWFFGHIWKKYDLDIPFVKIFKGPGWQMGKAAYEAARDMGYTVAIDRNQPPPKIEGLKTYRYNWSIHEPFPTDYPIVKAHGHMYATPAVNNDIAFCYNNLVKNLPTDAEFMTISEFLKWDEDRKNAIKNGQGLVEQAGHLVSKNAAT